ncbi:MAG: tandem-95 repeat protein, partial [Cyanobacteria bacterium J06623_1]
ASVATQPTNGTVVNNGDGTFDYTPNPDFNGADSFTYTISDSDGESSTAMVNITVDAVNDPPVAVDDTVATAEDTLVTIDAAANDTDVDGNLVPSSAVVSTQPANGTVTNNGDGTFDYTPNPDFNGADSFTYTISDSDGLTSTATVNITVGAVNDPPIITTPSRVDVLENTSEAIDINANDDNSQEGAGLKYNITGGEDRNLFTVNRHTGQLNFINSPDFDNPADANSNNQYLVQVTVTDAEGLTDIQNLTVNVTEEAVVLENPALDIEQFTNGIDADSDQDAALVNFDDTVIWTYQITNVGDVAFNESEIILEDDQQGLITSIVNRGDGDNILSPGEVWLYQKTGIAQDLSTTFDWELDLDGNRLEPGTLISDQYTAAGLTVSATQFGAMIFDSANVTGNDTDLATDNLDNILIISADGNKLNPDDNGNGGTITLEWAKPVRFNSTFVLDIEENNSTILIALDDDGNELNIPIPTTGNGVLQNLLIGEPLVSGINYNFTGSAAIPELSITDIYRSISTVKVGNITFDADSSNYTNPLSSTTSEINYPLTIEAEDIANITGYRTESNNIASGGSMLSLLGNQSDEIGTASFNFTGESGSYRIILGGFDENDGNASFEVMHEGNLIGDVQLDRNTGGNAASIDTKVEQTVAIVNIASGDRFTVTGIEHQSEHARLDFIRFEAVIDSTLMTEPDFNIDINVDVVDPVDEVISNERLRLEAEAADDIVNYRVEHISAASENAALSFIGGSQNEVGSATFNLNNVSGTYNIALGAFDENDGQAQFTLELNDIESGLTTQIGTLELSRDLASNVANTHTLIESTIAFGVELTSGDSITVNGLENSFEHARFDYLELTPKA